MTPTMSTTSTITTNENSQRDSETSSRTPTSASFTSSSLSSYVTSYARNASPSVCTLSFDMSGDEDIEVGDDGYDPSTGDYVGCVPVIGAGGVASGCGLVQSATAGPSTWAVTSSSGLEIVSTSLPPTNPAVVPITISKGQPKPSFQIAATTPSTPSPTTCRPDGAPSMSPTSWCDCGTAKYSTTPKCAFTDLPSNPLTPITPTSVSTIIPGLGGSPSCAVHIATEQGPAAGTETYCLCDGTPAPLLTRTINSSTVLATDCSYTQQPATTLWIPPTNTTAILAPPTPTTSPPATAKNAPHTPFTTLLVLVTTLLPPPPRPTIFSTIYITPPPPPAPATTTPAPLPCRQTRAASACIDTFSNVDEALCWANCVGGTCLPHENPFLNSEPWYVCGGCCG